MQDNLPSNGTVYMPNLGNKLGSMMKALRDWEKRRGLSLPYKSRFIAQKSAKEKQENNQSMTVPREYKKPGRKTTLSEEEKKRRKSEANKLYRAANAERQRQRCREWRARATPEQKAKQRQHARNWHARQKALKFQAGA